jgi:hypothetical protein
MHERLERFDAQPGDIRLAMPAMYPDKPVQPMTRWFVSIVVDDQVSNFTWKIDSHLWAYSSTDAVHRARADFYGTWATQADRERLQLRVLEVLQVAV